MAKPSGEYDGYLVGGGGNLSQCNEEMTCVEVLRLPHSSAMAFRYFGIDKF